MMLSVEQLNLSFGSKQVLHDFSFELADGEIACLLGSSGCGKTTALRCIAGFETAQQGQIRLNGQTLFDQENNILAHRRRIGMVFQDYALFPHLNVADNIAFGIAALPKAERQARVSELLELIGLPEYGRHYPHELSGGQQQRVALARALAPKPGLILLDEPFSSLDADLRARLAKEIRALLKKEQTGAVLVTHDQQEAFAMADKIGMMAGGRLQQWGTPLQVYRSPATPEVASFVGQGVLLDVRVADGLVHTVFGALPLECFPKCADWSHNSARILLRPDDVHIDPNAAATAEIKGKDFCGCYFIYELIADNGLRVLAQSAQDYAVGSRVGVRLSLEQGNLFAIAKSGCGC